MNNKRVTRKDVAEAAGVSPTIVSYVVNNNRYVDKNKRKRVLQAIEELGYQPNAIARSLKNNKTNHIAFIADEIENEHFGLIVKEIEKHAYKKGYIVSLCNSRNEVLYINQMIGRQFDGIIISSSNLEEELINRFPMAGIPTVVFGNRIFQNKHPASSQINIDIYGGAKKAIQTLIDKGYTDIAYIENLGSKKINQLGDDLRYKAYKDTLHENSIPIRKEYIIANCSEYEEVYKVCKQVLALKNRPNAIFAHEDKLAMVAMSAATGLQLEIPKELSIIGFDNSTISAFTTPPLSTVQIPRHELGKKAIEMLHNKINKKQVKDIDLDTQLILRGTT